MVANAALNRVLGVGLVLGLSGALLASCSSDSSKKVLVPDDGEAGAAGANAGGRPGVVPGGGHSGSAEPSAAGTGGAGGEAGALPTDAGAGPVAGDAGAGGASPVAGEGGAGGEAAAGEGGATCATPTTGRITIAFDSADAERVTNLQWTNSAAALTVNVTGQGGPAWCGDPQEFFGQSYGAPEGTLPDPVVGGNLATLVQCGADGVITSAAIGCNPVAAQMPVTTRYHFYSDTRASQMRITRTFGFDAKTPIYQHTGLRPYVARVSLGVLPNVIYPNQAGTAVTSVAATSCGGDCFTAVGASWNGKWFADIDPTSGLALIVLRDPSLTSPVDLTVNYDSYSNSNLTSFVVLQPADGWKAPLTETEYLCFADLTSWPQTARDAATLPVGCGP